MGVLSYTRTAVIRQTCTCSRLCDLPDRYDPDFIDPAARNIEAAIRGAGHIADHASTRRHGPTLKRLRLRIEPHYGVGRESRFAVPNLAVRGDRHAVGLGSQPPGRRPFLDASGFRVQPAEEPARV